MWRVRDTTTMAMVRTCLNAVVPQLPFGYGFGVSLRGLDDFSLSVQGTSGSERDPQRPALTVSLSLSNAFKTEAACQLR
jgi:hypothetical protein